MRQVHSAFALFVRTIGCSLEQPNDLLSGLIQRITVITRRFFLGYKLQHLLGHVGWARTDSSLPSRRHRCVKNWRQCRAYDAQPLKVLWCSFSVTETIDAKT